MGEGIAEERLKWIREASAATRRSSANSITDDLLGEVDRLKKHVRRLSLNGKAVDEAEGVDALLRLIGAEVLAASTRNNGAAELPGWISAPYRGRINDAVRQIVRIRG